MSYISVTDAIQALVNHTSAITETQRIPVHQSLGRTLAEDTVAQSDSPPFARSAMDGYAVRSAQTPGTFPVVAQINAGDMLEIASDAPAAIRIMTGAPIPTGFDAVVEQEAAERSPSQVRIATHIHEGRNVTPRAAEISAGTRLLKPGQRIGALHAGVMALAGYRDILVFRRPRVLLLTTGDELQRPGSPLAPGHIYNVNASLFGGLLRELGADVTIPPCVPDSPESVSALFSEDLSGYDCVLTTGGVSVGEKDRIIQFLQAHAAMLFWRADMHPGKSIAAARYHDTTILALSGNPGAALMSWYNIALPFFVRLLHGQLPVRALSGQLLQAFPKRTRETRFLRARTIVQGSQIFFDTDMPQASDIMTTYGDADVLTIIPHDSPPMPAGSPLSALRIPGLGPERLTWVPLEPERPMEEQNG